MGYQRDAGGDTLREDEHLSRLGAIQAAESPCSASETRVQVARLDLPPRHSAQN